MSMLPAPAEARSCPCAYPAVKRIYKPARLGVRIVINPVYPFYPYLRSSWRLYYGYPRNYYVYRTYRTVRRVRSVEAAPVIAEPLIEK
jgi:hypothetical protein